MGKLRRELEAAESQGTDLSHRLGAATDQITELKRQADVQVCITSAAWKMPENVCRALHHKVHSHCYWDSYSDVYAAVFIQLTRSMCPLADSSCGRGTRRAGGRHAAEGGRADGAVRRPSSAGASLAVPLSHSPCQGVWSTHKLPNHVHSYQKTHTPQLSSVHTNLFHAH